MAKLLRPTLGERAGFWALGALLVVGVGAMLVGNSLSLAITADEQPFVAAGAVAAREGQWPARDYPFFDMPGLVIAYAGLFQATDSLLPAARWSSAIAAAAIAGLLFVAAGRRFDAQTTLSRFGFAAAAVAMLITSPLFLATTGRALPHDLAAALAMGGVIMAMASIRTQVTGLALIWALVAGWCVGAAISTAAIYLPLALLLVLLLPFTPKATMARRFGSAVIATIGLGAGVAPVIVLVHRAPDTLRFATADLPFHALDRFSVSNGLASEQQLWLIRQLTTDPLMLVVLVAFAGLLGVTLLAAARADSSRRPPFLMLEIVLAMLAALATLLVGYMVTPTSRENLFAALPLVILTAALCTAYVRQHAGDRARVAATTLYLGAALTVLVPGVQKWTATFKHFSVDRTPVAAHMAAARKLHGAVADRQVLTLNPMLVLEADGRVYPPLLIGESAWRWASSMSAEQRDQFGLITTAQLSTLVDDAPPYAVLISDKPTRGEKPLLSYARYHRFIEHPMTTGQSLWSMPEMTAVETRP